MSEEQNLSKDFLAEAKKVSNTKNKKKQTTLRWVIAGTGLAVVLGVFAANLGTWLTPTNFDKDIPLSENISRWDTLKWGAVGNFEKDNLNTATGDWTLNTETGLFTSVDYEGCTFYFNKLNNPSSNGGTDLAETENYSKEFFDGQEVKTETAWINIKDRDTKGVEVNKTFYTDAEGNVSVAYYRASPLNGVIFFGTVRCGDEATLNEVLPDENGKELSRLGIWLVA